MKYSLISSFLFIIALAFSGCTTVIDVNLKPGATQLLVDGWLTDQPGTQSIRLTQTAAYFTNAAPPAATGASVTVTDNLGRTYSFTDPDGDSYYTWTPIGKDTLGLIGRSYTLMIAYQGQTYRTTTRMNRVPAIDSLIFHSENRTLTSSGKGYQAEFFARDFPGATDYYRVRYYRNDKLINEPGDLIYMYDAAQSSTFNSDGLTFIEFIWQGVNPDKLYDENDKVTVDYCLLRPKRLTF